MTIRVLTLAGCLAAWAAAGLHGGEGPGARAWVAHGGRWTVRDGAAWVDGGPGPKLVAPGTDFADGEAGVEVFFEDARSGNAGLIVRVSEAGIGADRFIGYEIALDPAAGVVRLGRHRHDFSLIRDIKTAVPTRRWVPLVARLKGDRIEVEVDGRLVASVRDGRGALPAGAVGLRPWQRPAGFRNLWVSRDGKRHAIELRVASSEAARRPTGPPLDALPPIAFITRHPFKRPFGIGTYIAWDIVAKPGGGICVLGPGAGPGRLREIFRRDDGVVFDMSASHDARKLLFSWRGTRIVDGKQDSYHIYEIGVDGGDWKPVARSSPDAGELPSGSPRAAGLRQLTAGRFHDIHPFYLPDGRVGFVSTRVEGYAMCQPGPACALFTMDADGGDIRRIEFSTLAVHSPWVLDDGSIVFTRWEYQDKNLTTLQGLWTVNPDGTRLRLFYGNTVTIPCVKWQAKPIPGTDQLLCTLAPHHGTPIGGVGILDRRLGLENPAALTNITPEIPYHPAATSHFGEGDRQHDWSYADPYPVGRDLFLVAYGGGGGGPQRFRLFALNRQGGRTLVHDDPAISCYNPVPLVPRPRPPVISPHRAPAQGEGAFLLVDVYQGLDGVPRGAVKALRVMSTVVKRCNMRGQRAYDMDPLVGRGTYYVKHCYGTVPVEHDGSAHFRAPAGTELYFSALDADGKELCRMGSVTQAMPGETQSCVGCHEPRQNAPPNHLPAAARKPPAAITPPSWGAGPIDFVRLVQPVLDRHCVRCHGGADPKAGLDLSGDKTRFFSQAYDNLVGRGLVNYFWLLHAPVDVFRPMTTGSHASRLIGHLEKGHNDVTLDGEERRRLYTWIEANVPYYGTYDHTRPGTPGSRDAWAAPWYGKFAAVWRARCGGCHGKEPAHQWLNLTRPRFSRVLAAPLVKAAGGLELCRPKGGKPPARFADKADADYAAMLAAIEEGRRALDARPRMDMPGAKPLPYPQDFGGLFTGFAGP